MSASFWRFLGYARPYTLYCLGSVICGVFKFSLALALPGALGLVVRYAVEADLTAEQQVTRLAFILAGLVVIFALRAPMTYYRTYFAELAGNRAVFDVRRDVYNHLLRLSLRYHADRRTGETISRVINDVNTSQGILDRGVLSASIDFIFLVGVVIALIILDWRLALVSLSTLPIYGAMIVMLNPRLRGAAKSMQDQVQEMSGEVAEKLGGLPVVFGFVREKSEEVSFFRLQREYLRRVMRWIHVQSMQFTATEFLTAAGPLVVIGYGGYRVIQGDLRLDAFVWFYGFISHLYLPTRRLADASPIVQERLAALDRVFAVLDEEPDVSDRPGAMRLKRPEGRLEFRHVHFAYRSELPVLQDIHLEIPPGQSIAIVGRSGAGKTTLVNLVPRFYDVSLGAIMIDGHDLRDVQVRSLREHIGIVTQDPILFSGTIRENIMYGRRGATEEDIIEAARMAHVDEFMDDLPEGYDTLIGERGVKLSGGQKQRVAIARAFLRDPRILILDEATSNLDSHAENIIQDALDVLMKGRTTLVIAHRLSTIVNCDRVIVLEDGRIVQQGTHESLLREEGPYRTLCEEQFGYVRLEELGERRA